MNRIVYRLTNIDTQAHRYFAKLQSAKVAGLEILRRRGSEGAWKHSKTNFSPESSEGWQLTDGTTFLSIIPLAVEA